MRPPSTWYLRLGQNRRGSNLGGAKTKARFAEMAQDGQDRDDARRERELRAEAPCRLRDSAARCRGSYGGMI